MQQNTTLKNILEPACALYNVLLWRVFSVTSSFLFCKAFKHLVLNTTTHSSHCITAQKYRHIDQQVYAHIYCHNSVIKKMAEGWLKLRRMNNQNSADKSRTEKETSSWFLFKFPQLSNNMTDKINESNLWSYLQKGRGREVV